MFCCFPQDSDESTSELTDADKVSRIESVANTKGEKNDILVLPEVMIGVWFNSGTLWVHVNKARNLAISKGKLYVKAYLLPDSGNSKQKTGFVEGTQDPHFNATMAVSRRFKVSMLSEYPK